MRLITKPLHRRRHHHQGDLHEVPLSIQTFDDVT